MQTVE